MGSAADSLNQLIDEKAGVIKKNAPYQPLTPVQDEEEEEIVSLASSFDNEVDPFEVEQEPTPAPSSGLNAIAEEAVANSKLEALNDPTFMYGKKQRFIPGLNQEYTMDSDMLNSMQGLFPEGTNLFGSSFIGGGGGFGGSGSGGGTTGSIELTEEGVQAGTEDFIRNQITSIGLDPATFTSEQLTDATEFRGAFEPQKTKFLEDQRGSLYDLYKAGDTAEFSKIYDQLDTNSQLNLLHTLYEDDTLDKKAYLNLAASTLATEDARQYASYGLDEPMNQYLVVNDYDTGDRLYRYNTSSGPETAKEVVLLEDQKYRGSARPDDYDGIVDQKETFLRELGTTNSEGADKRSSWVSTRDDALIPMARIALAVATGSKSEQLISAIKLATGETLHASDYASLALGGMEMANIITAPVDAATAAQAGTDAMNAVNVAGTGNAIAAGNAAQAAASAGTGILGLGYNASKALITGVATGDPVEAIALAYGPAIVKKAVDKLGVGAALNTFASNNNINADDLNAGISKTLKSLAKGDDIEDAVLKGVGKYITEGGTILPDAVEDALGAAGKQVAALVEPVTDVLSEINKNYIKPVTSEVGDVLSAVDTEARGLLSAVDDKVLQPITRPVGDVLSTADTAARQGLSAVDDAVLNPVGDVVEDVGQAVGDVAEDAGQAVGDALSAAETAVRQVIGDIDLPDIDIDLPDLDLPDIDLPDIDLPDIGLNIPQVTSAPSPTRTTGGLFDVAQFEHDEGISLVGNLLTGLTEQDAKKLSKKQFQQPKEEMVDLLSNPFSSSFN